MVTGQDWSDIWWWQKVREQTTCWLVAPHLLSLFLVAFVHLWGLKKKHLRKTNLWSKMFWLTALKVPFLWEFCSTFWSGNSNLLYSFFFYFLQNLSNPVLITHCCCYSKELTCLNSSKFVFQINYKEPDFLWNVNVQIATVWKGGPSL